MTKPSAALIACVKSKHPRPMAARDIYSSALFQKSASFAESNGLKVWVLSAKYYLIPGDRIIAPYEQTLNKMNKDEIEDWSTTVAEQVSKTFESGVLLVLAGEKYLSFCQHISNQIINPLKGLPIGRRLQWLNQHTR